MDGEAWWATVHGSQTVGHVGNFTFTFTLTGRTDAEAATPILWPPNAKNRLIGKDPDAGKD